MSFETGYQMHLGLLLEGARFSWVFITRIKMLDKMQYEILSIAFDTQIIKSFY